MKFAIVEKAFVEHLKDYIGKLEAEIARLRAREDVFVNYGFSVTGHAAPFRPPGEEREPSLSPVGGRTPWRALRARLEASEAGIPEPPEEE